MTVDEQAKALERSSAQFHRVATQPWRATEDRQEALHTMKAHLIEAERIIGLPATQDTASARSKLILWAELVKGTLKECGENLPSAN